MASNNSAVSSKMDSDTQVQIERDELLPIEMIEAVLNASEQWIENGTAFLALINHTVAETGYHLPKLLNSDTLCVKELHSILAHQAYQASKLNMEGHVDNVRDNVCFELIDRILDQTSTVEKNIREAAEVVDDPEIFLKQIPARRELVKRVLEFRQKEVDKARKVFMD